MPITVYLWQCKLVTAKNKAWWLITLENTCYSYQSGTRFPTETYSAIIYTYALSLHFVWDNLHELKINKIFLGKSSVCWVTRLVNNRINRHVDIPNVSFTLVWHYLRDEWSGRFDVIVTYDFNLETPIWSMHSPIT